MPHPGGKNQMWLQKKAQISFFKSGNLQFSGLENESKNSLQSEYKKRKPASRTVRDLRKSVEVFLQTFLV